jgi:hypothetical protein
MVPKIRRGRAEAGKSSICAKKSPTERSLEKKVQIFENFFTPVNLC